MSTDMERLQGRLDDQARRIGDLEQENGRTLRRLRRLESDRAAVRELVRTVQKLAERTYAFADQAEQLVESAAERAVEKAYGRRIENRWRLVIRLATVLTALSGVAYLVVRLVFR